MDWSRAKTIMIVSFLLLNVLLGYQQWSKRADHTSSTTDNADLVQETTKLLNAQRIKVETQIPIETPKLSQLTGKLSDKFRNSTKVSFQKSIPYSGGLLVRNTLRDVMQQIGIEHIASYKVDTTLSKQGEIVYLQTVDEYPLFEYAVTLYESGNEITGYKQSYIEVQSGGDPREQRVISAYTAIRRLAENGFLPEGSIIQDIRMGYQGQRFDSDTQYMLPFWRISTRAGESYYVQAFTGEVLEGQLTGQMLKR